MPALIDPILRGEADYTKGNRYVHARQLRSMPLLRRVGNLGLSFLTKLASGYWNMFDPTNGYTAIHARLIPLLNEESIARRYFFESSMLLELSLLRAVVRDVHIPAKYGDETSHLSELATLLRVSGAVAARFPATAVDPILRARFRHRLGICGFWNAPAAVRPALRGLALAGGVDIARAHADRHGDARRASDRPGRATAPAGGGGRHSERPHMPRPEEQRVGLGPLGDWT